MDAHQHVDREFPSRSQIPLVTTTARRAHEIAESELLLDATAGLWPVPYSRVRAHDRLLMGQASVALRLARFLSGERWRRLLAQRNVGILGPASLGGVIGRQVPVLRLTLDVGHTRPVTGLDGHLHHRVHPRFRVRVAHHRHARDDVVRVHLD